MAVIGFPLTPGGSVHLMLATLTPSGVSPLMVTTTTTTSPTTLMAFARASQSKKFNTKINGSLIAFTTDGSLLYYLAANNAAL